MSNIEYLDDYDSYNDFQKKKKKYLNLKFKNKLNKNKKKFNKQSDYRKKAKRKK
tara:strand:- start:819 stop:980 length:162 start_codon:yes stop_codon:yes gene_type:complete